MKTSDFTPPLTSAKLNENMNKMFGVRVKLENYSREQLEDMRNKLRTRVFQQEGAAGINDLLTNETYQKDKAMLDLLNTRIKEMLGEDIKKLRDKMDQLSEAKKGVRDVKHTAKAKGPMAKKDYDGDGKIETGKDEVLGSRAKAAAKAGHPFKEAASKKCCCSTKGKDSCPVHGMKEGWDDMMNKVKSDSEKEKTSKGTGKFDKKTTTTGTVYTRKSNTFDNGTEDKPKEKKVKEATDEKCNHTAKGKKCPVHGMKECSGMYEAAKPDFLDMDKDGNKKEPMKSAVKSKKKVKESFNTFKHNVRFVNESIGYLLQEDEEGKAKAITAAGDMVNDFTSWMQRVGQYQTKTMIELADAIKADFGAQEAEAFKQSVGPALSATLETLTQQREAVSNAVASLAGEAVPDAAMGMEPAMPPEPGMDSSAPDEMNPMPAGDEFGAADAAAGAGTTGREMRESSFARKLAESHSIMSTLAK